MRTSQNLHDSRPLDQARTLRSSGYKTPTAARAPAVKRRIADSAVEVLVQRRLLGVMHEFDQRCLDDLPLGRLYTAAVQSVDARCDAAQGLAPSLVKRPDQFVTVLLVFHEDVVVLGGFPRGDFRPAEEMWTESAARVGR